MPRSSPTVSQIRDGAKRSESSQYVYLNRALAVYLTWFVLRVFPRATPNGVTWAMIASGLGAVLALASYATEASMVAVVLFLFLMQLSSVLDCVDGNIARIKNMRSQLGLYLDKLFHNLVEPLIFVSLALIFAARGAPVGAVIATALLGVLKSLNPVWMSYLQTYVVIGRTGQAADSEPRLALVEPARGSGYVLSYKRSILSFFPFWVKISLALIADQLLGTHLVSYALAGLFWLEGVVRSVRCHLTGIQSVPLE